MARVIAELFINENIKDRAQQAASTSEFLDRELDRLRADVAKQEEALRAFRSERMGALPERRRIRVGERELLLVHGSPRRVNEFLFHSTCSISFLELLATQNGCDGVLCTHTGLHWHRRLPSGKDLINVGTIGRPANDGKRHVWYAMLRAQGAGLDVSLLPLRYDAEGLAQEMRSESLPEEFIDTILGGWWTTCLEILPARERAASKF